MDVSSPPIFLESWARACFIMNIFDDDCGNSALFRQDRVKS